MKVIECARDAMQGIPVFIPTEKKITYLNQLLKVGFDTIDFGSFVSSKAIPQMRDTHEVVQALDLTHSLSKLLAIVANRKGAEEASQYEAITFLGYPLSLSATFQMRNTRSTIPEALNTVQDIQDICVKKNKTLVVYISMGFGNPYGDPYEEGMVVSFVQILQTLGIKVISVADTVGLATPDDVYKVMSAVIPMFQDMEIGVHLHASPQESKEKVSAAFRAGCTRFDGALKGIGGCPFAKDELVGNVPTEVLLLFLQGKGFVKEIDQGQLQLSLNKAGEIFPNQGFS